ncbi:RNA polymerase sigma-70 factor (ECF subfamily) [Bacillus thermophilus]|uniref:RNA polymerase sigma-70 factor (ECF subfamily) n=1 Tax=Siminovitchia thermophila TaxID=1245522 RepID=A0ABS2R196_9BACI|nr:RNA polymerase sigma factor [Siminovitchia thermophila]MBM7713397.1 RNA polymerase sigma-70 factor (ECF subfamily) [Siminovitchia thermophila]ONK21127.1 RNA polymerase subunit sigma [Bacillus sp. VT-16-64]
MDFEEIYREYFQEVYLFMKSLSHDEGVAEEMTQEAFFKALKAIEKFDGSKDIRAWLFTIAKNTYFSHYKKMKRQINSDFIDEPGTGVQIVQHLMNEEEAFTVHQFLHSMDEPYKEVFSLRTFGELPFEKIGRLFGKSAGWARVTFYRARKKILEYMEEINHERD